MNNIHSQQLNQPKKWQIQQNAATTSLLLEKYSYK
jgi:hypothetical protein